MASDMPPGCALDPMLAWARHVAWARGRVAWARGRVASRQAPRLERAEVGGERCRKGRKQAHFSGSSHGSVRWIAQKALRLRSAFSGVVCFDHRFVAACWKAAETLVHLLL